MKSSASFQQRSQRQRAHRCPETNWILSGGHTPRARIQLVSALHQPTVTVCQSTQQLAGLLDRGVLGSQLLQPKQGVVQGAGEEGQRVEEGTHSSQQVVGKQFRWAAHNRDRGEQKYDHTLHQPPLQCRDNTAPVLQSSCCFIQQPTGLGLTAAALSPQGCWLGQAGPTWGPDDKQSQTASCFLPASVCWGDGATSPTRPAWTAGQRRSVTMKPRERSINRSGPEPTGLAGEGPWHSLSTPPPRSAHSLTCHCARSTPSASPSPAWR